MKILIRKGNYLLIQTGKAEARYEVQNIGGYCHGSFTNALKAILLLRTLPGEKKCVI